MKWRLNKTYGSVPHLPRIRNLHVRTALKYQCQLVAALLIALLRSLRRKRITGFFSRTLRMTMKHFDTISR